MLFNSFIFFIFLALTIPLYYSFKLRGGRNALLVFASYFFYGYWDWRFCVLLILLTGAVFIIGVEIDKTNNIKRKNIFLFIGVIINLGILFFFKYYNFFIDSFQSIFSQFNFKLDFLHIKILLPVGISYFTFQSLAYLIDIYRGNQKAASKIIDFALFIAFFPKVAAGPIERASDLLPQIARKNYATKSQLLDGSILIIYGLFKKVMIGDAAGRFVDHIFAHMGYYSSWEILVAWLLFSIQIYADFSGYTNIARGTAKLFGFELIENFEQPYLSKNIADFWKRWHMSMTTWFRDYLFLPISFALTNKIRNEKFLFFRADLIVYTIASIITWFFTGLWHGANTTFIVWGMIHGFFLILYQWQKQPRKILFKKLGIKMNNFFVVGAEALFTLLIINLAWLFFRVKELNDVKQVITKFGSWAWGNYPFRFLTILLSFALVIILFDILERKTKSHVFFRGIRSKPIMFGILTAMFLSVVIFLINSRTSPFIYFQF